MSEKLTPEKMAVAYIKQIEPSIWERARTAIEEVVGKAAANQAAYGAEDPQNLTFLREILLAIMRKEGLTFRVHPDNGQISLAQQEIAGRPD